MKVSEQKRQQILDTARDLFLEKGFATTAMHQVAEQAEVSKRTLYRHFPTKEVLFAHVLGGLAERCVAQVNQTYQPDTPLEPQLRSLLHAKLEILADPAYVTLARIGIPEVLADPERAQQLTELLNATPGPLLHWLEAAAADGHLEKKDVMYAGRHMQGILDTFAFWPQLLTGAPRLDPNEESRVVDTALTTFLQQYAKKAKT
ncbi:TetR/AcrR family transcriptional regulator [Microbulbifer agarilyticus]|uniref:TetR/AcrR family transcriptional regulator n=1 Tax=Microbulbifer agarilyticus TaxID=260552 RepID=UPI001C949BBC|nr:TetR/AcrR family transcriptional regulator [Microbulbifer agarilyticus]MBY6190342.1 TetR/AcrR family transcriptional regulator [Microbulbifer agarilyticus]